MPVRYSRFYFDGHKAMGDAIWRAKTSNKAVGIGHMPKGFFLYNPTDGLAWHEKNQKATPEFLVLPGIIPIPLTWGAGEIIQALGWTNNNPIK